MVVLSDLMEIVENVNPPRITDSVQLDRDEQAIVAKVSLSIEEGLMSIEEEFQRVNLLQKKKKTRELLKSKLLKSWKIRDCLKNKKEELLLWNKMME
jgi:hypothetical protein